MRRMPLKKNRITNLYINANQKYVVFFGCTSDCTIKDLTFEKANKTLGGYNGQLPKYGDSGAKSHKKA